MRFKEWNEIAESVGIAAIVGSLIFVGLQLKQAQEIKNAERRMIRVTELLNYKTPLMNMRTPWCEDCLVKSLVKLARSYLTISSSPKVAFISNKLPRYTFSAPITESKSKFVRCPCFLYEPWR